MARWRSVADLHLALSVMNGPDLRDPYAVPAHSATPMPSTFPGCGWPGYLDDGISPPSSDVAAVVTRGGGRTRRRGAMVRPGIPGCVGRTMDLLWRSVFLGGDRGQGFEADLAEVGVGHPSEELAEFRGRRAMWSSRCPMRGAVSPRSTAIASKCWLSWTISM
jgi:amidase